MYKVISVNMFHWGERSVKYNDGTTLAIDGSTVATGLKSAYIALAGGVLDQLFIYPESETLLITSNIIKSDELSFIKTNI